jgi:hypothetical protein
MQTRFRLIRRGNRSGFYYSVDRRTGSRCSLKTDDLEEARRILDAKNDAERQSWLNLQLAKAYLAGADSSMTSRTWRDALVALTETKQGANQHRWHTVAKDRALAPPASVIAGC